MVNWACFNFAWIVTRHLRKIVVKFHIKDSTSLCKICFELNFSLIVSSDLLFYCVCSIKGKQLLKL